MKAKIQKVIARFVKRPTRRNWHLLLLHLAQVNGWRLKDHWHD